LKKLFLSFHTKEKAIEYARKNNISYNVIEPNKKEFVIKSYADNFSKIKYVEKFFRDKKWFIGPTEEVFYYFLASDANLFRCSL